MKNIASAVFFCMMGCAIAYAQNEVKSNFMTVYQKNGSTEMESSKGIIFVKDENSNRYAWQSSDWATSDFGTLGSTFDIRYVKSIFRNTVCENHYTVSIPEGAPINESEVILKAHGEEITATEDNQYVTDANIVSAVNKQGRLIYDCYASVDTISVKHEVNLNAMETAYTLLLPTFPGFFESTSDEILDALKTLLQELPEVQALAGAIDRSIVKYGYLEMAEIDAEYQNAVDRIIEKAGLRNNYLGSKAKNGHRNAKPGHDPYIINGNSVYGLKLVMNSSEWKQNSLGKAWSCNMTAYNSNRFAYTAWVKGYKDGDGFAYFYNSTEDFLRGNILKPQRVTTFMDKFTSWEGISDYFSDTYKLFFEDEFGFGDMTWDKTKLTFDMAFFSSNDVVICVGPADNDFMMYYNVMKTIMDPLVKCIAKKLTGAEQDDYMLNFCISLVADEDFRYKFYSIINGNKTYGGKAADILNLAWPKMKTFLKQYVDERLKTRGYQYVWDHWGFTRAGELQKAIDDIDANWNKWLKTVEKVGDIVLGVLGLFEHSFYYDIAFDFNDSEINVPTEGLVGYYPFNGNADDASGNGNHGILSGNQNLPELTTDRFGRKNKAYEFGGYYNYNWIRVPNSTSLVFDKEFTMSFWIQQSEFAGMNGWMSYTTSDPCFAPLCKAGDGNATFPGLYITTSKGNGGKGISVGTNNSNGNSHNSNCWNHNMGANKEDYKLGDWLHIALVVNNREKILYLDGIEAARDELNKEADFSSMNGQDLYIGIMAGGNMSYSMSSGAWYPFYGKIDDVRVYRKALNASDINSLFREPNPTGGAGDSGGSSW